MNKFSFRLIIIINKTFQAYLVYGVMDFFCRNSKAVLLTDYIVLFVFEMFVWKRSVFTCFFSFVVRTYKQHPR